MPPKIIHTSEEQSLLLQQAIAGSWGSGAGTSSHARSRSTSNKSTSAKTFSSSSTVTNKPLWLRNQIALEQKADDHIRSGRYLLEYKAEAARKRKRLAIKNGTYNPDDDDDDKNEGGELQTNTSITFENTSLSRSGRKGNTQNSNNNNSKQQQQSAAAENSKTSSAIEKLSLMHTAVASFRNAKFLMHMNELNAEAEAEEAAKRKKLREAIEQRENENADLLSPLTRNRPELKPGEFLKHFASEYDFTTTTSSTMSPITNKSKPSPTTTSRRRPNTATVTIVSPKKKENSNNETNASPSSTTTSPVKMMRGTFSSTLHQTDPARFSPSSISRSRDIYNNNNNNNNNNSNNQSVHLNSSNTLPSSSPLGANNNNNNNRNSKYGRPGPNSLLFSGGSTVMQQSMMNLNSSVSPRSRLAASTSVPNFYSSLNQSIEGSLTTAELGFLPRRFIRAAKEWLSRARERIVDRRSQPLVEWHQAKFERATLRRLFGSWNTMVYAIGCFRRSSLRQCFWALAQNAAEEKALFIKQRSTTEECMMRYKIRRMLCTWHRMCALNSVWRKSASQAKVKEITGKMLKERKYPEFTLLAEAQVDTGPSQSALKSAARALPATRQYLIKVMAAWRGVVTQEKKERADIALLDNCWFASNVERAQRQKSNGLVGSKEVFNRWVRHWHKCIANRYAIKLLEKEAFNAWNHKFKRSYRDIDQSKALRHKFDDRIMSHSFVKWRNKFDENKALDLLGFNRLVKNRLFLIPFMLRLLGLDDDRRILLIQSMKQWKNFLRRRRTFCIFVAQQNVEFEVALKRRAFAVWRNTKYNTAVDWHTGVMVTSAPVTTIATGKMFGNTNNNSQSNLDEFTFPVDGTDNNNNNFSFDMSPGRDSDGQQQQNSRSRQRLSVHSVATSEHTTGSNEDDATSDALSSSPLRNNLRLRSRSQSTAKSAMRPAGTGSDQETKKNLTNNNTSRSGMASSHHHHQQQHLSHHVVVPLPRHMGGPSVTAMSINQLHSLHFNNFSNNNSGTSLVPNSSIVSPLVPTSSSSSSSSLFGKNWSLTPQINFNTLRNRAAAILKLDTFEAIPPSDRLVVVVASPSDVLPAGSERPTASTLDEVHRMAHLPLKSLRKHMHELFFLDYLAADSFARYLKTRVMQAAFMHAVMTKSAETTKSTLKFRDSTAQLDAVAQIVERLTIAQKNSSSSNNNNDKNENNKDNNNSSSPSRVLSPKINGFDGNNTSNYFHQNGGDDESILNLNSSKDPRALLQKMNSNNKSKNNNNNQQQDGTAETKGDEVLYSQIDRALALSTFDFSQFGGAARRQQNNNNNNKNNTLSPRSTYLSSTDGYGQASIAMMTNAQEKQRQYQMLQEQEYLRVARQSQLQNASIFSISANAAKQKQLQQQMMLQSLDNKNNLNDNNNNMTNDPLFFVNSAFGNNNNNNNSNNNNLNDDNNNNSMIHMLMMMNPRVVTIRERAREEFHRRQIADRKVKASAARKAKLDEICMSIKQELPGAAFSGKNPQIKYMADYVLNSVFSSRIDEIRRRMFDYISRTRTDVVTRVAMNATLRMRDVDKDENNNFAQNMKKRQVALLTRDLSDDEKFDQVLDKERSEAEALRESEEARANFFDKKRRKILENEKQQQMVLQKSQNNSNSNNFLSPRPPQTSASSASRRRGSRNKSMSAAEQAFLNMQNKSLNPGTGVDNIFAQSVAPIFAPSSPKNSNNRGGGGVITFLETTTTNNNNNTLSIDPLTKSRNLASSRRMSATSIWTKNQPNFPNFASSFMSVQKTSDEDKNMLAVPPSSLNDKNNNNNKSSSKSFFASTINNKSMMAPSFILANSSKRDPKQPLNASLHFFTSKQMQSAATVAAIWLGKVQIKKHLNIAKPKPTLMEQSMNFRRQQELFEKEKTTNTNGNNPLSPTSTKTPTTNNLPPNSNTTKNNSVVTIIKGGTNSFAANHVNSNNSNNRSGLVITYLDLLDLCSEAVLKSIPRLFRQRGVIDDDGMSAEEKRRTLRGAVGGVAAMFGGGKAIVGGRGAGGTKKFGAIDERGMQHTTTSTTTMIPSSLPSTAVAIAGGAGKNNNNNIRSALKGSDLQNMNSQQQSGPPTNKVTF